MSDSILPMMPADLAAVCRLGRECFPTQPWDEATMRAELTQEHAVVRVLRPEPGRPPCAFSSFWLVYDEAHLHHLATRPDMRRRGYARALLQDLYEVARAREAHTVMLEVRRSNRPAVALYQAQGFVLLGVRPQYYSDNREDALVMCRTLG